MEHFIPERPEDLTSHWLTQALRETGHLEIPGKVTSVEQESLGEGEGFMGEIVRLRLSYQGGKGPETLVAKMPRLENRAMGELIGLYERESCFYNELSQDVPLRSPHLYFSDFDVNPIRSEEEKVKGLANRTPGWLMPRVTRVALWAAKRRKRRYLLLLEDLGDAAIGDQLAGTDPERCTIVLTSMARAHAALWENPILENRHWLVPLAKDSRVRQSMFLDMLKTFRDRHLELFDEDFTRTVSWVSENGIETIERMHREAPETLLHGDLRLDNLAFRGDDPVFFDWQGVRRGPAAYDVAWFLSGASEDLTTSDETEVLHSYHKTLEEHGVEGYPFEALHRHYQMGLLSTLQTMGVLTILDMGEGRGAEMAKSWIRRLRTRLATIDVNRILDS